MGESAQELLAIALLHLLSLRASFGRRFPLVDLRRHFDAGLADDRRILSLSEQRFHSLRLEPPFRDEAVTGQPSLQRGRSNAVLIDVVAARDGAKPFDIEISILDFEGIEGPFDQFDATGEGFFALHELQAPAETGIAMVFAHRQHVRVQVDVASARAGNGEREADHGVPLEGTHYLAADLVGDDKHSQRHQFRVGEIPDFFLQCNAGAEFFDAVTTA